MTNQWVDQTQMVLYGHRSIVNQVRYNPQKCFIASSGVEKVIKVITKTLKFLTILNYKKICLAMVTIRHGKMERKFDRRSSRTRKSTGSFHTRGIYIFGTL
jgi:hypothetical protein